MAVRHRSERETIWRWVRRHQCRKLAVVRGASPDFLLWGPHVRFCRVQILVREGSPWQAAHFGLVSLQPKACEEATILIQGMNKTDSRAGRTRANVDIDSAAGCKLQRAS